MQQEMLLRDEETMELRETFTTLQQEVEIKTKKLKKVRCWQEAEGHMEPPGGVRQERSTFVLVSIGRKSRALLAQHQGQRKIAPQGPVKPMPVRAAECAVRTVG